MQETRKGEGLQELSSYTVVQRVQKGWTEMALWSDIFYICICNTLKISQVISELMLGNCSIEQINPKACCSFWNNCRQEKLKKPERKYGSLYFSKMVATIPPRPHVLVQRDLDILLSRGKTCFSSPWIWVGPLATLTTEYDRSSVMLSPGIALNWPGFSVFCFLGH